MGRSDGGIYEYRQMQLPQVDFQLGQGGGDLSLDGSCNTLILHMLLRLRILLPPLIGFRTFPGRVGMDVAGDEAEEQAVFLTQLIGLVLGYDSGVCNGVRNLENLSTCNSASCLRNFTFCRMQYAQNVLFQVSGVHESLAAFAGRRRSNESSSQASVAAMKARNPTLVRSCLSQASCNN